VPELPEVETVCRTLSRHIVGRRVVLVDVREARLRRPVAGDLAERLAGRTILGVRRRAKYILIDVGEGLRGVVHLGMSGRLCVGEPPAELSHVHVVARLEPRATLYFRDPRRFGLMMLSNQDADLGLLGVEPLGRRFSGDLLWEMCRRHPRLAIKTLIMDQRLIVGVGNIYASEALHEAGIRPTRRARRLTRQDAARLSLAMQAVLRRAIASRGSSLLDYRDGEGNAGAFQRLLRVYDREGEACPHCGVTIRRVALGARSSFFCPGCQR
jgi:formamidopyrimidine-DNA glycosylase